MLSLRNKMNDHRGKKRGKSILTLEMVTRGEVVEGVKQVMAIKEGTCYDELQVLYNSVEPLYYTIKTNVTLHANYTVIKIKT